MKTGVTTGGLRRAVLVVGAVGQFVLPGVLLPRVRRDLQPPEVMQPAPYTFAAWLPIYATSLAYSLVEVVRKDELVAGVGWPLAGSFMSTTGWAPLLTGRHYWPAQAALFGTAGFAEVARRRVAAADRSGALDANGRVLPMVTTGLLAGWGAAAAAVNLASMLVAEGPVWSRRRPTAVGVITTLVLGGLAATATSATDGHGGISRIYPGTVLWALAGIVAGRRRDSPAVAAAAALAAVPVVLAAHRALSVITVRAAATYGQLFFRSSASITMMPLGPRT